MNHRTNTISAIAALTAALFIGANANAGVIYDGFWDMEMYGPSGNDSAFGNVIGGSAFSDGMGTSDGYASISGNQESFNVQWQMMGSYTEVLSNMAMSMTFTTDTLVTVDGVLWFDFVPGEGFYTGGAGHTAGDGTAGSWVIQAGDTVDFYAYMSSWNAYSYGQFSFTFGDVPAPGALALLAIAGVTTCRRRR